MEAPMAGIVTIVFALLLSRRLGWNADAARIPLLAATVLFASALCFPTIGVHEKESGWIIAADVATALGGILLVIAVLQFQRKGRATPGRPDADRARRHRKPGKTAGAPPPPYPDDPYAGPHGDSA